MQFKRVSHVVPNYIKDECLVLDGSNGSCHILNETAGWLLHISKEDFVDLEQVATLARKDFLVPTGINVQDEIRQIVLSMEQSGIVEIRWDASNT